MTWWISRTRMTLTGFDGPPTASSFFAAWHTWPAASTPPPSTSSGSVRRPWLELKNSIKNFKKQNRSVNFCYCLFPNWNQGNQVFTWYFFESQISIFFYGKRKTWNYDEQKPGCHNSQNFKYSGKKFRSELLDFGEKIGLKYSRPCGLLIFMTFRIITNFDANCLIFYFGLSIDSLSDQEILKISWYLTLFSNFRIVLKYLIRFSQIPILSSNFWRSWRPQTTPS